MSKVHGIYLNYNFSYSIIPRFFSLINDSILFLLVLTFTTIKLFKSKNIAFVAILSKITEIYNLLSNSPFYLDYSIKILGGV